MRIVIEAGAALRAAAGLTEDGAVARRLRAAFAKVGADVSDPGLRAGLVQLADVLSDVLELVEADLMLLAAKVRGASQAYDRVEGTGISGPEGDLLGGGSTKGGAP